MNIHPNVTPASPSLASPHFDASFDSIESLTTSVTASVVPTLETTTVTEVVLGYDRNGHYSITAMTTSTGAVADRNAYTAYGQPTIASASGTVLTSSAIGNRYTYTGREWDETLGLHHFRARWMSPLAGGFLERDPIGFTEKSHSLYLFLQGAPLTRSDPSGHLAQTAASGKELNDKFCSPGNSYFHFELDFSLSSDLNCTDALLIRKVNVTRKTSKCNCEKQKPGREDTFTYYEMEKFKVAPGESTIKKGTFLQKDKVGHSGPFVGGCGSYKQNAVTKIFCLSSILHEVGALEQDWNGSAFFPSHLADGELEFGKNWCRTGGSPYTREKLDWFDGTDSDDGTIVRKQTLDFCCCGENEFFKTTSSPSPL